MNKRRRKNITEVSTTMEELLDTLQTAFDEENGAWENLPENMQASEAGLAMVETANALEDAINALGEAQSNLAQVIE